MAKPVKIDGKWTCPHHLDSTTRKYITDDGHWLWDPKAIRFTESGQREGGDWYPNPDNPEPGAVLVNAVNNERTVSNMLFNITVTSRAVSNANTNAIVKPEEILEPQDQVVAQDQNAAILAFGVKHASTLKDADLSNAVVYIRQGA